MVTKRLEEKHPKPFLKLGKLTAALGLSPNALTLLALIFGAATFVMFLTHHLVLALLFGLLSAYCDTFDGIVAQLTRKKTKFGRLFDVTSDKYVEGLIIAGIALIAPHFLMPALFWGLLAIWGSILISLVSNVGLSETPKKPFKLFDRGARGIVGLIGVILAIFFDYSFLTYALIAFAVLSHITVLSLFGQYYFILRKKK